MSHKFTLFIFFLWCNVLFSQVTETKGNLLRIDFTKPTIDLGDTLWQWYSKTEPYSETFEICKNAFIIDSTTYLYLCNYFHHDRFLYGSTSYCLRNTRTNETILVRAFAHVIDVIVEPYMYDGLFYLDSSGVWILNGIYGNAFINNQESIYFFNTESSNKTRLTHIIGKVGNEELVAVQKDSINREYEYYIADLSSAPNIELGEKITIDYSGWEAYVPYKIVLLKDSLYLITTESSSSLFLASYSNNTIKFLKELKDNVYSDWYVFDENIYCAVGYYPHQFVKEKFDFSSLSFKGQSILFDNISYSYRIDSNYLVVLDKDSLYVYNYKKEKIMNKYDLSSLEYLNDFIMCEQYVYLHQIKTVTDVNENYQLPKNFALFQNYPNPFNPSTTINYQLPTAGHVTLKIYDALGREVATLVNEYKQAGSYNSQFSTDKFQLSSGVYFYDLRIRDSSLRSEFGKTMKMLMIK